jgi:hypothetical protein
MVFGGGTYNCKDAVTVSAVVDACYEFVNWTEDGEVVSTEDSFSFYITEDRNLVANFKQKTCDIITIANPPDGGTTSGDGADILCGTDITVWAVPNPDYSFVNWTENGIWVSDEALYTFTVRESRTLTANFVLSIYEIIVQTNSNECGSVSGGGFYNPGDIVTVTATIADTCCTFIGWIENDIMVSTDNPYTFTATESRTLIADFGKLSYNIIAEVNNSDYGYTTGSGLYESCTTARVEAFTISCYRFENWTVNGVEVSKNNPYSFEVKEDITLIANFSGLDFDTYAPTLWNNTFMLDLRKLEDELFGVLSCKWFKNGIEERNTRTINEFSYSAGPKITDLLEPAPTWYMFQITTRNYGTLCSTHKTLAHIPFHTPAPNNNLVIYPNPTLSGSSFTVEGVVEGDIVQVFNQYGICVNSTIAKGNSISLTLNVQTGTYLIQAGNKQGKIVVLR